MEIDLEALNARMSGLPAYLGIRFVEATKHRLVAELTITENLKTRGGRPHGGTRRQRAGREVDQAG